MMSSLSGYVDGGIASSAGRQRFLVTGGCGFIGSHLASALLAFGCDVRILDDLSTGSLENKPDAAELIRGDVADLDAVRCAVTDVDGIFHLAAIASVERCTRDCLGAHRVNLAGTLTVFEAARYARLGRPIPVVYASSAAVYGDPKTAPVGETSPAHPCSAYGVDKLGCELHAAAARGIHRLPSVGLRFFNVFGPGQDPNSPYSGVISVFCARMLRRVPISIHGDGSQVRDLVFVSDVVAALVAAMCAITDDRHPLQTERAWIFNVCTGRGTTVLDLAFAIGDQLGIRPSLVWTPPRTGDIKVSLGDPTLARKILGFSAGVDLASGLALTLAANRTAKSSRDYSSANTPARHFQSQEARESNVSVCLVGDRRAAPRADRKEQIQPQEPIL